MWTSVLLGPGPTLLAAALALAPSAPPKEVDTVAQAADRQAVWNWMYGGGLTEKPRQGAISFTYGGRPFEELRRTWQSSSRTKRLDRNRTEITTVLTDPSTGLELKCVTIEYRDFPAVDWVVYLKNKGKKNTPIIEGLNALDALFPASGQSRVHHIRGSDARPNDFEPLTETVPATGELTIFSHGGPTSQGPSPSGSPSVESMPFFNVDSGRHGVIVGLGWDGPWTAGFAREEDGLRIRARMEATHLYLRPGEHIRSPRVLLLFWKGDQVDSQNLWRRLILAHYSPTPGGKPFTGLIADANWSNIMDAEHHIQEIEWWKDHDIPMECYWMDAAWTDMSKGWFSHQSMQTPNAKLFPKGMKPISDAAHKRGMKYLLWFVPHGLDPEVGIGKEHPEFLGPPFFSDAYPGKKFYALDHGKPEINRFAIDYFSKIVRDFGVDVFRQDGTAGWPADEGPERTGMAQCRYIEGFYEFWDGLLKNNPKLLIDNCATGARRVELETMKRSIALHRSDAPLTPNYMETVQSFNQGTFPWIPLHGGVTVITQVSAYNVRSAYCPALLLGWPDEGMPPSTWITDVAKRWAGVDLNLLRRLVKEYRKVRPYVFGDYYPLTPYSRELNVWVGWQWNRPDLGEGMVQLFRRPESAEESMTVKLHGLDPEAVYVLTDADSGKRSEATGKRLMEDGVSVTIKEHPGSALLTYARKGDRGKD